MNASHSGTDPPVSPSGTDPPGSPSGTDPPGSPSGTDPPGSPSGTDPLPAGPDGLLCSARGCRRPALYDLQWNNPKIHTTDRRKHWLACDDHRDSLSQFLSARGFLKEVLAL